MPCVGIQINNEPSQSSAIGLLSRPPVHVCTLRYSAVDATRRRQSRLVKLVFPKSCGITPDAHGQPGPQMTNVELENPSLVENSPRAGSSPAALPELSHSVAGQRFRRFCAGLGLFLAVLGVYLITSPGRIDIIDGEARFDVAYSLVRTGKPIFRDPLIGPIVSVPGRGGYNYSYYGAPASFFGAPLVWLGLRSHAATIAPAQFMFSLTSAIFGAGIAPMLFLFYLELGVTVRRAILWTLVSSFATMVWPLSDSSFDNAQHAFFALTALYCAYLSVKRNSWALAAIGGLCAGILIQYQEYFVLLVPCFALATLDS